MPFVPTPIIGALSAIANTRKNQEVNQDAKTQVPEKENERSAFMQIFFGPGK